MPAITGRDRAKIEPFWATSLSRMTAGPRAIANGIHALIQRSPVLAPYMWIGSGWRTGSSEHKSGRAIDIMITADTGRMPTDAERAAGNALVGWLIANAKALGVQGIIFSRDSKRRPQLWGYSHPGTWVDGAPRGSISGDHVDHVHVYFTAAASWPASLSGAIIGAPKPVTPRPQPPKPPATGASGLTLSVAALKAARYADPPKKGMPVGKAGAQVKAFEQALVKCGYLKAGLADGHYGTATVDAVKRFQRQRSGAKNPDGWMGAKELTRLRTLARATWSIGA